MGGELVNMASDSSLPELGSGIGRLRESLSAVRNLQQLLASIHAGPRLLSSLLPEVTAIAAPMMGQMATLLRYVGAKRRLDRELAPLEAYATACTESLERALTDANRGALLAKKRLQLEASLRQLAPELGAVIEHIELLVDSVQGAGVVLPVSELLSSRPDHGSSRPVRELTVWGPAEEQCILLPPRVGLGAMSILAATSRGGTAAVLVSSEGASSPDPGRLRVSFLPPGAEVGAPRRLACAIPAVTAIAPSRSVAEVVLSSFGAVFSPTDPVTFTLPVTAAVA